MLFLVLPVAFLAGRVSIFQAIGYEAPCSSGVCPGWIFPMQDGMALYLVILGAISIFLGLLVLRLDPRPRSTVPLGLSLGFAASLGLIAFLSETAISRIQETFLIDPQIYLLFPDLSIAAMVVATVVFVSELVWVRFSLPSTITEANVHQ